MYTDLDNFIEMLSKSDESFSKIKLPDEEWFVDIKNRNIRFWFTKDKKYRFCTIIDTGIYLPQKSN